MIKIKFNWGTGIVITIIGMVLFMGVLVFITTQQDFYLVEDNYYEKSVVYQGHIDKIKNANQLKEKIKFVKSRDSLELIFPSEAVSPNLKGTVYFYSPVNKSFDFKTEINLNKNFSQKIKTVDIKEGRYTVKIDWSSNGKEYFQEQQITIE